VTRAAQPPGTHATLQGAGAGETPGLRVFIVTRDSACGECHEELGRGRMVFLAGERGALCLTCADLDHLLFLPRGDPALTRRARRYSGLSAVVLEWSRTRKRYERQGLLVERQAVERAETECLDDAEARARRSEREAERRAELDLAFVAQFATAVREQYPGCPPDRAEAIAAHACARHSGRVGRSADARRLGEKAVHLAVVAHVRHTETRYDELLHRGDRDTARHLVREDVDRVLDRWSEG
jgi:hypothetical protein